MKRTFAFALAGLLVATTSGIADDAQDVRGVIGGQIESFKAGRHEEAFGYAAAPIRTMFRNKETFVRMVQQGYRPIYGAKSYRFGRSRGEAGTMFQEVMITGPAGGSWVALYTLRRNADGEWKIAGVRLVKGNEIAT